MTVSVSSSSSSCRGRVARPLWCQRAGWCDPPAPLRESKPHAASGRHGLNLSASLKGRMMS